MDFGPILHATFNSVDMSKPDAPMLVYFRQDFAHSGSAKWVRSDHDAGTPGELTGYTADKAAVFTLPVGTEFLPSTIDEAAGLPGAQTFVIPVDQAPEIPTFHVVGPNMEYHLYVAATDATL